MASVFSKDVSLFVSLFYESLVLNSLMAASWVFSFVSFDGISELMSSLTSTKGSFLGWSTSWSFIGCSKTSSIDYSYDTSIDYSWDSSFV